MLRNILSATSLIYLALSGAAQAATLFTPAVSANFSNSEQIDCRIANVSSNDMKVRIQVINVQGAVNNDLTLVLPAGQAAVAEGILPPGTGGTLQAYCRFDGDGKENNYRALAAVIRFTNGWPGDIAVVPAR